MKSAKASSPTWAINKPKLKLITKTKAKISKEWSNGWSKCLWILTCSWWCGSHVTSWSSSFGSLISCFLKTKSTKKPIAKPITNLEAINGRTIIVFSLGFVKRIINASSLQLKKTAINVPIVMYLPIYKSAARTLVPHWGIIPKIDPNIGAAFLFLVKNLESLSSIKDKRTWNIKTKANTSPLSFKASNNTSITVSQVIPTLFYLFLWFCRVKWLITIFLFIN